jgi:phosphohistidine phosphatase SixA/8-oxo-dGTP pyrophosphatase MutT (NUDIX family)
MARSSLIRAAGAVIWREAQAGDGIEVVLVHRPKYDDWSLPKGKQEAGEHILVTATREILEETGHTVTLGPPLATVRYRVREGDKEVRYWAARADDGAAPWRGTKEIDRVELVSAKRATKRLTQPRDADLVNELVAALGTPPHATSPLVLLRHAKALARSRWDGADGERPLEPKGSVQAERLPALLRTYGVTRVVTSDATRCVDTVRPLADAAGLPLELEPRLSEEAATRSTKGAASVVRAEVRGDSAVVLCSHRPVMPALLEVLAQASSKEVKRSQVLDTPLTPGAFLVLHRRDGEVVAAEHHEP